MARSGKVVALKPNETPEEKFRRLATKRVNHILKHLRILGNLASPNYRFTDDQIGRIFEAIDGGVDGTKGRFRPRMKTEAHFSF
jgi:hypothetical protein